MLHLSATFFDDWRETARHLVLAGVPPHDVRWIDGRGQQSSGQEDLFGQQTLDDLPAINTSKSLSVSVSFLSTAKTVTFHRSPERWELLYRMLWRITRDERHLMNIASDPDVVQTSKMEKAVRRDAHKMKAFVRFREVTDDQGQHFIAWHRPDHYSLRYTCEFFAKRFDVMRWTIMTPDDSVVWDGRKLTFGPGMPRSEAPDRDDLESLWKTYYAHIFNPARIKLKAMQAEMPKKHWPTMPETELIPDMLRDAPRRVEQMIRYTDEIVTASAFIPNTQRISELRTASQSCEGCELCGPATQTVFGIGPPDASLVVVGEQPGDQEDLQGEPFVGPAGQLLNKVLAEVGLDRKAMYLTNAVKHFKYTRSGKRRLHKKPSAREVAACRPWLDAELTLIRPQIIVCLGATAAGVVIGKNFRLTDQRGIFQPTENAPMIMATYHPSALLRASGDKAAELRREFKADWQLVQKTVASLGETPSSGLKYQ